MNIIEGQFLLFEIDEENEDFTEIEIEDGPIHMFLDTSSIFIIVDPVDKEVWVWHGGKVSIRQKFIAIQKAPIIRDMYGVDFRIAVVDEGSESSELKEIIGL